MAQRHEVALVLLLDLVLEDLLVVERLQDVPVDGDARERVPPHNAQGRAQQQLLELHRLRVHIRDVVVVLLVVGGLRGELRVEQRRAERELRGQVRHVRLERAAGDLVPDALLVVVVVVDGLDELDHVVDLSLSGQDQLVLRLDDLGLVLDEALLLGELGVQF